MPSWFPYPIRYVGDCGISGRGYSMRGNLAALREVGITEEQIDVMPWPPSMSLQRDWFYDRFLRLRDRPSFVDTPKVNIIDVRLTDVGQFWTAGWYNVVVADWDTDRLPEDVVEAINRCDEVWTASENVIWTLRQSGVELPALVIPPALQPELLETPPKHVAPDIAPEVHPHVGPHEFKHTAPVYFYYIGDWSERTNVDGLLQAYVATGWRRDDPVELLIHSPGHRRRIALLDGAPIARVLTTLKSYSWVCKLHQMNHVFVTATRADGFCLPAWEAAAVGNLVIVPEDALETPPGALTYETRLTAAGAPPGQKWWEPDLDDLTRQFRVAFDLIRAGWLGTDWAVAARKQVSPGAVGERLKERLVAIGEVLR